MDNKIQEQIAKAFSIRFEEYNTQVLKEIAETIKKFKGLNYTDAHKLAQQLKYNKSYIELLDDLTKLGNLSKNEAKKVLEETVKQNLEFADTYYKARNLDTPIYEKSKTLQNMVNSIANMSNTDFNNIAKATGFRLLTLDKEGNKIPLYLDIKDAYNKVIDECVYAIQTGQETFDNTMRSTINQLAESGVRFIEYNNEGKAVYSQRIDTVVRRNILDSIRQITIESNQQFGKEFDADGIEVTVHSNPAPDHMNVQGHQFYNKEFKKFQNNQDCKDVKGIEFPAISSETGRDRRSIGEYNCYHTVFPIIVGVDNPLYTDEELQDIIDKNNQLTEIDGKKYTKYEITQLQRDLETEIRKSKDKHIMYKETDDKIGMLKEQKRITQLTRKYKEISKKANINEQLDRARVSGYRKIGKIKYSNEIIDKKWEKYDISPVATKMKEQYKDIGEKHFNNPGNDDLNEYVIQSKNMFKRMEDNKEYKNKMVNVMKNIDDLKVPIDNNYVLYSGGTLDFDLTKSEYVISTTIGIPTARQYMIGEKNPIMNTIYAEKGARLISTYNTKNNQFTKQGELIIPISEIKNLIKIQEGIYLLKK